MPIRVHLMFSFVYTPKCFVFLGNIHTKNVPGLQPKICIWNYYDVLKFGGVINVPGLQSKIYMFILQVNIY